MLKKTAHLPKYANMELIQYKTSLFFVFNQVFNFFKNVYSKIPKSNNKSAFSKNF